MDNSKLNIVRIPTISIEFHQGSTRITRAASMTIYLETQMVTNYHDMNGFFSQENCELKY